MASKNKKSNRIPPPPPPPPPTTQTWNPIGALMSAIGLSKSKKPTNAAPKDDLSKQAMSDIFTKIEKGEFRLRPIRIKSVSSEIDVDGEDDPAVSEVKNILTNMKIKGGSLRDFTRSRTPVYSHQDFTQSLRLRPTKGSSLGGRPDEADVRDPELQSALMKRLQRIDDDPNEKNSQSTAYTLPPTAL